MSLTTQPSKAQQSPSLLNTIKRPEVIGTLAATVVTSGLLTFLATYFLCLRKAVDLTESMSIMGNIEAISKQLDNLQAKPEEFKASKLMSAFEAIAAMTAVAKDSVADMEKQFKEIKETLAAAAKEEDAQQTAKLKQILTGYTGVATKVNTIWNPTSMSSKSDKEAFDKKLAEASKFLKGINIQGLINKGLSALDGKGF